MTELFEVNPASDWSQRWLRKQHGWRHRSEGGFDPSLYTVEAISEAVAKDFVTTHHYSGTYPAAIQRYGLLHRDAGLVGVLVLGAPVQTKVLTTALPDLEPFTQSAELARLVLLDGDCAPANSESFFVARAFSEAAALGMRGIVSFSDPCPRRVAGGVLFPGHVGITYQALNGRYCGRGTARTLTLLPDGTVFNERSRQKVRKQERGHDYVERKLVDLGARPMRAGQKPAVWLQEALDDLHVTRVRHRGNHRYVFPIGSAAQRRRVAIGLDHFGYPKRPDLEAA